VVWWLTGTAASDSIVSHSLKEDVCTAVARITLFVLVGWTQILLAHTDRLPVEVLPINLSMLSG
jgi:hypothetical protein